MNPTHADPHLQALDRFFTRFGGGVPDAPSSLEVFPPVRAEGAGPSADLASAPAGPPEVRGPEDLEAAHRWLLQERRRLEAYTRSQLARMQEERQALVQQHSLNEQSLVLRSQELTRREEAVLAQGRALQQQGEDLSRREQALVGQLSQWWDAQQELAALQEANQQVHQDTAAHRSLLDTLRAEVAAVRQSQEAARAELENLLSEAEQQRQSRAREEEVLRERQAQLERRLREAERTELAGQQRLAELDDLEASLRKELETQERQLARERQEVSRLAGQLRQAGQQERADLQARQAEAERRERAAREAEAEVARLRAGFGGKPADLEARERRLYEEVEACCRELEDQRQALQDERVRLAAQEANGGQRMMGRQQEVRAGRPAGRRG